MRRLLAAGAVLLVLILGLGALPARLLPTLIGDDALRVSGLSGTLARGTAARAMLRTPAGFLHLGSLQWSLRPSSLLRLAPRVDLESTWGTQRAALSLTWQARRVVLQRIDASLDAELVRTVAPLAVDGRLSLLLDEVIVDGDMLRAAEGRVVWQDAVWQTQGGARPLGSYAVILSTTAPGRVAARVETLAGPVFANGSATLDARRYEVALRIDGGGRALETDIDSALRLFATPQEDGYLLRLDGDLGGRR